MKGAALALALACVLMSSAAQVLMKLGMNTGAGTAGGGAGAPLLATYAHALGSPLVWTGLGLYGLSAGLWIWVLSRLDVSLAYPLVSLGFVLTMVIGVQWLGEPFSWQRLAGCGLIVAGVLLLAADA
jgi:multidrug transporter EmrE-like cation transporter